MGKPMKNRNASEERESWRRNVGKPMKNEKADEECEKPMIHEERESQWRTGKPMKNWKVHEQREN